MSKKRDQFNKKLGFLIRAVRKQLQKDSESNKVWSQEIISDEIGLHQTALCRVELGLQSLTAYQVHMLSGALGVPVARMFGMAANPDFKIKEYNPIQYHNMVKDLMEDLTGAAPIGELPGVVLEVIDGKPIIKIGGMVTTEGEALRYAKEVGRVLLLAKTAREAHE